MLRIQGAHVDPSIPGWLLNANATYAMINQARRAAHELAARPDVYGFDPTAVYTLFCQTWDRALSDIRSVAFGRNVTGHSSVSLLPDPYYIDSRGYRDVRRVAAESPRWASRSDRVAWRGSVTGDNDIVDPADLPRVRLALACRDIPGTDVGLMGVHPTMHGVPTVIEDFITSRALKRDRWSMREYARCKFVIDIDGHANAWGLLEKLILGICVLKVETPYEQWYYDRLKPWRHYVPIKADLSNLAELISWCRDNEAHCAWIAHNGARLAASLRLELETPQTCRALLAAAYPRRMAEGRPSLHKAVKPPLFVLLDDAAAAAEAAGAVDRAIDAYTKLIDEKHAGAGMLIRRHELFRERGAFAAAQSDLEKAVAADPWNDEAPLRLGQFLASVGRDIEAVRYLRQAVSIAPARAEIGIALAGSCLALGWLDEAFRAVRPLPTDLPGWWSDLRIRAISAHGRCRDETRDLLRGRRPGRVIDAGQMWRLAINFFSLGRLHVARRLCRQLIEREFFAFAPCELENKIIARLQGPPEALRHLAALPSAARGGDQWRLRRAQLLADVGAYHQVPETLDAVTVDRIGPAAQRLVGFAATMLGEKLELRAHCGRWMDRSPHDMLPTELLCAAQPLDLAIEQRASPSPPSVEIGQYWSDRIVPDDVREIMDSWTEHHPGLRRHIHHEESARAFLLAEFGLETLRAFDLCPDPVMKADYFRLGWLNHNGGAWIDADQRCTRPVGAILSRSANTAIAAVRSGYITGFLANSFLAAKAGSKSIEMALEMATAAIRRAGEQGERPWGWAVAGAGLLTRVAARSICRDGGSDVVLLPPTTYRSFAATSDDLRYEQATP